MTTAAEVLRIGPWTGGLNTASDPASVADNELVQCVNLELDIDGSLKTRPPYMRYTTTPSNAILQNHIIIGSAMFAGVGYIFASGKFNTGTERIRYSTDGVNWTDIATGRYSLCSTQYAGKVWFPPAPGSGSDGGSWDPVGGFTVVSALPRASACVVHKERLYVVPGPTATSNNSRLSFSAPANFTSWPAENIIDVSPGDGQTLNDIIVVQDNLMMFKNNSTFVLAYDLNPADAILREMNTVIGVAAPYNVAQYENVVYILHEDKVYEIVNYEFGIINPKVKFVLDATIPGTNTRRSIETGLSLVGDRLLIHYWNRVYVYGLRTQTWGEWFVTVSSTNFNIDTNYWHVTTPFVKIPNSPSTKPKYVAARNFDAGTVYSFTMTDEYNATDSELGSDRAIGAMIKTKDYDMADPIHFKRLFWWSADVLCGNPVLGSAYVVQYQFSPTWGQFGTLTWGQLGTWGNLVSVPLGESTTITGDSNFTLNKTVKFRKSLRFRKINFEIAVSSNGRSTGGPCKIFSMTTTMRTKQGVVKSVS